MILGLNVFLSVLCEVHADSRLIEAFSRELDCLVNRRSVGILDVAERNSPSFALIQA